MSIQQQIQASYNEAFDHSPSSAELTYWMNFFNQSAQIAHYASEPWQVYPDLIHWHKDYMATNEGRPTRIDVITKAYQNSLLKATPTQAEVNYWLWQPSHTYRELTQYCDSYAQFGKPAALTLRYKWQTSPPAGNQSDNFTETVQVDGKWIKGNGAEGSTTFSKQIFWNAQKTGLMETAAGAQGMLKQGIWSVTATVIDGEGPSPVTCTVSVPGTITFDTTSSNACKTL